MLERGIWWLRSESDPRWSVSGEAWVGMFTMSDECKQKLEELKEKYGEPPGDLEWWYLKH